MKQVKNKSNEVLIKSEERKKKYGEVFTPSFLVNEMLNTLPNEIWGEKKTFLDPSCGNGNFLIEVLRRKIKAGQSELEALKQTYGVELLEDNVEECKIRLLTETNMLSSEEAKKVIDRNIICADFLKLNLDEMWNDVI